MVVLKVSWCGVRWCAGCGKAKGAVLLPTQKKMCEACGLKPRGHGLAAEGKVRWCGGCGKVEGAVPLNKYSALHPQMCEDCGLKSAAYGLASKGRVAKARWCGIVNTTSRDL